jgi:hypothetical protein
MADWYEYGVVLFELYTGILHFTLILELNFTKM